MKSSQQHSSAPHFAPALASAAFGIIHACSSLKFSSWHYLLEPFNIVIRFIMSRINAWLFLFYGPDMIQKEFEKADGRPFEMFAPDQRLVFVSSPSQIKELDTAPDTVLSLQAASKQMLQPRYSMHGFNWFDRRGTEGVGFIRALRTLLTNHVPKILPDLGIALTDRLHNEIALQKQQTGASQLPIYPMIVKLVVLANSLCFFGEGLARNEEYMKAALSYIEETLLVAETVRLLPRFLYPVVGALLRRRAKSQAIIYKALMDIAEERVYERDNGLKTKHNDCIQWIMETSPKQNPWSAQRIVFELMAIWFGSVHAMSTTVTFAIQDLCIHPEYVEPIRQELESAEYSTFEHTARGLPLLDSFIKESARLTPVESLSTRRQATKPFQLADGTKLAVGDWACTPVKAIMHNPVDYPQPLDFNGFRFVDPKLMDEKSSEISKVMQPRPSKLTDVGNEYHVWGTGRMSCPGRFYASAIMKILVAQVILGYDLELVNPEAKRWWTWRSTMLPYEGTLVNFSPRTVAT